MVAFVRRCHDVFLMISFEHKMDLKIEHVGVVRRILHVGVLVPFVGFVGFDLFCL